MDSFDKNFRSQMLHTQEQHPAEDDETIWLLSYADLMTLLFTFFVMLYSSMLLDDGAAVRRALAAYMQGSGEMAQQGMSWKEVKESIEKKLDEEQLLSEVKLELKGHGLEVTFSSSMLFDLGSAELRPEVQESLKKVIETISMKKDSFQIRVEGHTDDNPIVKGRFKSNWELSGARAAHIVSQFESHGFDPSRMIAVGYGSSRPLESNRSPAGIANPAAQRVNRRVVLTLFKRETSSKELESNQ